MSDRIPFRVTPMLATLVDAPFDKPGWVYEEKYDGYRLLAYKEGARVTLLSRNGLDRTERFANVAHAIAGLSDRTLLLDGEAVAFDRHRVSRFQLLQKGTAAVVFAVFDCLYRNGQNLRSNGLAERRTALEQAIGRRDPLLAARRLGANGLRAFALARQRGFEGLVAKNGAAPYREGRSREWLKIKVRQEEELVIGGYTAPRHSRAHFGALLLGAYRGTDLRYVGSVGTGFTAQALATLYQTFQPLVTEASPFLDPPRRKDATWLAPTLVAQIAFREWTADAKLRQPVFLGLRDDETPGECLLPEAS